MYIMHKFIYKKNNLLFFPYEIPVGLPSKYIKTRDVNSTHCKLYLSLHLLNFYYGTVNHCIPLTTTRVS